jgi:hypothetical protein
MFDIDMGSRSRDGGVIERCSQDADLPRPALLCHIGQRGSASPAKTALDTG